VIGKLARKIRGQSKGMLGPHLLTLQLETIIRIHRGLSCQAGHVSAQYTSAYGVTIAIFCEVELR
jgi:hypothetical protein